MGQHLIPNPGSKVAEAGHLLLPLFIIFFFSRPARLSCCCCCCKKQQKTGKDKQTP